MNLVRKWLFRFVLVVIFVVTLLAASDNSQQVPLRFLDYQSPEWPISWWMLTAFVLGVLLGVVFNTWSNARLRMNVRRATREVEQVGQALDKTKAESVPAIQN